MDHSIPVYTFVGL